MFWFLSSGFAFYTGHWIVGLFLLCFLLKF